MAMLKRPRDPNQLAKLIVDIATGEVREPEETEKAKRARKAGGVHRVRKSLKKR